MLLRYDVEAQTIENAVDTVTNKTIKILKKTR